VPVHLVTMSLMDEVCRVFLIGDSLFTDTLGQLLGKEAWLSIKGTAVSPQAAIVSIDRAILTGLPQSTPHLIILVHAGDQAAQSPDPLLEHYPDVRIICADLNRDYVQVITSHRIGARSADLLSAIADLMAQQQHLDEDRAPGLAIDVTAVAGKIQEPDERR
jgi:hypothetical protein